MQVITQAPRPISERTIRALRRKTQVRRKVDPNRIQIFDLLSDEEIQRKINEECMFTDFAYAASKGFVPTSKFSPPGPNWGGKYKCLYCNAKGYMWRRVDNSVWWGYVHGNKCRKKV